MEALRWRLEAETSILRRPAPIPLHPLEVQDPLRIRARLEQGLQALWRERADVLKGEKLSDDALKVLWRLLQAARSGESYRQLPAQREVVALRTLLDATVLPLLSGPLQLCPPVGDLRYGNTLILLSLSDTGTFPHSHWQMTAAAFVLDTVFGEGELEQITWLYPRRQATISFHPDALFEFGRGRAVGRDFRRQLAGIDWNRLRQARAPSNQQAAPALTPVLALHLINRATKEPALRQRLFSVPGSPANTDRERIWYLYELKERGVLALLDDGLLQAVMYENDTLLVVGETAYGQKGFHIPLQRTPARFRHFQRGSQRGPSGQPTPAQPLAETFNLEMALSVLVDYLGRRSGHKGQQHSE